MAMIKKRQLDKDGYPMVTAHGWGMVNGRARFYQPAGGLGGLLLMLEMTLDKPVADATGLKGTYDIEMHWVGDSPIDGQIRAAIGQARANVSPSAQGTVPDAGPSGPTIQRAMRDQLGLKLELKKGPVETLVIDHADRVPTEN